MAYKGSARGRKRPAIGRVWWHALFLALPGLILAAALAWQSKMGMVPALLVVGSLLVYCALVAASLVEAIVRPLQTLSNVVASLREGDTSFRARGAGADDAMGELAAEINALADLLQKQRVRSLESTALLARMFEVMHAPLFAFDRESLLQIVNQAGLKLLGLPHARSIGHNARDLGLLPLLEAPDHTVHEFGSGAKRWLLRRAAFRQDGVPHTLLLLADVSVPLREEEQIAWKRLIRVLGHELSNSLAPIKSIAGSLLARVDGLAGDALPDFRRGLGVIESRADGLHRFVQSYRKLAQLPSPRFEAVDVAPLVERVVILEQRIPVQLVPGPAAILNADSDQLEQMLINLLANGADASLANGAKPMRVSWRIRGTDAEIVIEDRGPGIANPENLFVPFYTTKSAGSGIGLALAQQIARAHGGEISLVNRLDGEGARATVRLPLGLASEPEDGLEAEENDRRRDGKGQRATTN